MNESETEGLKDAAQLALNTEEGATSKEDKQLLQTAEGKGTDVPLEPEYNPAAPH